MHVLQPRALFLAVAALLTIDAAARAQLTITLDAPEAVWNQPLGFTVTGTGCAAWLEEPILGFVFVQPNRWIEVVLHDACPVGVQPQPFTLRGELHGFLPDTYDVTVIGSRNLASQRLQFDLASAIQMELPAVAPSGQPLVLDLRYFGSCANVSSTVEGGVVLLTFDGTCPFEPLQPHADVAHVQIGPLAPGTYPVRLHEASTAGTRLATGVLHVRDARRCFPADDRLCLQDGRFAVSGTWRAFDGSSGVMHAAPLPGNEQAGLLWFFDPANAELTVKTLEGCGVNGRWWVFLSSSSTVQYELLVDDTVTGASKVYRNAMGEAPTLVDDTGFEVCP